MRQHENWRKRNCKVYCYKLPRIDLHHKLQLLIQISCFFGLLSIFVADFENVLFCWKRYSTKTTVVLILKYLAQQRNTYSESVAETLKADSRDCASLLTTCCMSKALLKCFLVYFEHVVVYCDVFAVTTSFSMYLLYLLFRAKFAQIFKNTFFEKHLQMSSSLSSLLGWVKVKTIHYLFYKNQ